MAGSKKQRRARPAAASRRRKFCFFCKEGIDIVDYKDYVTLRRFMSERAKIRSR
ncbi:MAG: 30S ribosomal protein S18, partial [Thermoleophilia bacterium]|nr:30S ribosomal protein S18 [Thermoleophilia bacterium]